MASPILFINAGIIGVAFTMGLVSLIYGFNTRQWKDVGIYSVISLMMMAYTLCTMEVATLTDLESIRVYYRLASLSSFVFFGFLPLMYRKLYGQDAGQIEYLTLGTYGLLTLILLYMRSGLGWKSIKQVCQADFGYLGVVYQPVLEVRNTMYLIALLHLFVMIYCVYVISINNNKYYKRWLALLPPILFIALFPVNIGMLTGFCEPPMALNPVVACFLYLSIGVTLLSRLGQIRKERDFLADHLSEREARLSVSETRFHQLFDGAADAFYLYDSYGRVRDVNLAACASLGYSRQELLSLSAWDVGKFIDEAGFQDLWTRVNKESAVNLESYHRCKNGSTFPVDLRIIPFKHESQPLLFAAARDIRSRKAGEQERKGLEERLQQASKLEAIGRLAGGVAHDFKNLLTAMLASLDLAKWEVDPESNVYRSLEGIGKAIEKASALTQQLLAFSRRQVVETQILSLNDLLNGMGEILKRCLGGEVVLEMDLSPAIGNVRVDPGQFEQVIMNLVVNAKDAMPNGGYLVLKTSSVEFKECYQLSNPQLTPGRYVCLSVSDSGEGMSPDVQSHVFEPFFTTKPKHKGTGLGLAMVFGILNQLGGSIQLSSELGRGTVFKLFLPVVKGVVEPMAEKRVKEPQPPEQPRGICETILMVEDEDEVRWAGEKLLKKMGFKVFSAANGKEALDNYLKSQEPIHVLVTDVMMPGMNGKELAERWNFARPGTPVLFVSGYTNNILGDRALMAKDVHFLEKPYSRESLYRKLREILDNADKRKPPQAGPPSS